MRVRHAIGLTMRDEIAQKSQMVIDVTQVLTYYGHNRHMYTVPEMSTFYFLNNSVKN